MRSAEGNVIFCPMATGDPREISQPQFHFIIDFGEREGVPVLVEQQVLVVDDLQQNGGIIKEFWAIALMEGPISEDVVEALSIPLFWFGYANRNHIRSIAQVKQNQRCPSRMATWRLRQYQDAGLAEVSLAFTPPA